MNYLLIPFFLILFASAHSQTYLYERNKSKPRFEIYSDKIYEFFRGKRVLTFDIEENRLYLTSKMGYDGAGNPTIIPRELVFSFTGERCYTYFREEGNQPRYYYHVKDNICYTPSNGELFSMFKYSDNKIVTWYPGNYDNLVARIELQGGSSIDKRFLFYLANLKSND